MEIYISYYYCRVVPSFFGCLVYFMSRFSRFLFHSTDLSWIFLHLSSSETGFAIVIPHFGPKICELLGDLEIQEHSWTEQQKPRSSKIKSQRVWKMTLPGLMIPVHGRIV